MISHQDICDLPILTPHLEVQVRRTVRDVEVVAHRQAPHSASDTGGDALPPQVPHPSGCAPVGGSANQKGCFSDPCVEIVNSYAEEMLSTKQKSVKVIMNSIQSAEIQHAQGRPTRKTGCELCPVKLVLRSCCDEMMLTQCSQHVERVFETNRMRVY